MHWKLKKKVQMEKLKKKIDSEVLVPKFKTGA